MGNNKHFELTNESISIGDIKLYRIKATKDLLLHNVKKGDLGGFVQCITNLTDNAWVSDYAKVSSNEDFCGFQSFGSENRSTTAFKTKNGISVNCGCFTGTLKEFKEVVNEVHGDSKFGKEYKCMIKLIKIKLG